MWPETEIKPTCGISFKEFAKTILDLESSIEFTWYTYCNIVFIAKWN